MKIPLPCISVLLTTFVLLGGIQSQSASGSTLRHPLPEIPAFSLSTQSSSSAFEWSAKSRQLYSDLIQLKLPGVLKALQQQAEAQPGNGMLIYLQNYADIVGLLISEDANLYETLPKRESQRLDQLAELSSDSPYYLFTQAEVKLQCALVKFKFGDEIRAGWSIRQAYKLLVENKKKFPGFLPNDKSLGFLHILIGSVPSSYEWIVSLAGMEGSVSLGVKELENVAAHDSLYSLEATLLLQLVRSYVLQKEANKQDTWLRLFQQHPDNLLVCFLVASALSKEGNSEEALTVLRNQPLGKAYVNFPYLSYLKAEIQLQKGEYQSAVEHFQAFLSQFKGQNLLKDTYYKLFLCHWLNNEDDKAMACFRKVPTVGTKLAESDRYAQHFYENASKKKWLPHKQLMKARLASDGGYYAKALAEMKGYSETNFTNQGDKAEYNYRKARIYHKQAQIDSATPLYERAIVLGSERAAEHTYFGANSALQLGYIYQQKGQKTKARQYFKQALSWPKHEYKSSIDTKAKAALSQLGDE